MNKTFRSGRNVIWAFAPCSMNAYEALPIHISLSPSGRYIVRHFGGIRNTKHALNSSKRRPGQTLQQFSKANYLCTKHSGCWVTAKYRCSRGNASGREQIRIIHFDVELLNVPYPGYDDMNLKQTHFFTWTLFAPRRNSSWSATLAKMAKTNVFTVMSYPPSV